MHLGPFLKIPPFPTLLLSLTDDIIDRKVKRHYSFIQLLRDSRSERDGDAILLAVLIKEVLFSGFVFLSLFFTHSLP